MKNGILSIITLMIFQIGTIVGADEGNNEGIPNQGRTESGLIVYLYGNIYEIVDEPGQNLLRFLRADPDHDPDDVGSVSGEPVYAENTEYETDEDAEITPPATINYEGFLDFRNMTYNSPTSWARTP